MFVDFATDSRRELQTDLCIVGAGPAGMTIARELIGSRTQVLLLESGGLEPGAAQQLNAGDVIGSTLQPPIASRIRVFGGTTFHWTGMCGPLHPLDFERRSWVPHSGWPISRDELLPYYKRARALCDITPTFDFDDRAWALRPDKLEPLDFAEMNHLFWQYSPPTRFGVKYRPQFKAARNVTVLLNATATQVQLARNGDRVERLDIRDAGGRSASVRARNFVIAGGGIENARLLLLSNSVVAAGVGNGKDNVGRYFMEHPHVHAADIVTDQSERLARLYQGFQVEGVRFRAGPKLSEQTQRRCRTLNATAIVNFQIADNESGAGAAKGLYNHWRRRDELPDDLGARLWRITKDLDDVIRAGYDHVVKKRDPLLPIKRISLSSMSEHAPNPASRIKLADEKDALGQRKVQVDWRLTQLDKQTIATFVTTLGTELGRLGMGRVRMDDWLMQPDGSWSGTLTGGCHHMGTTRMASAPEEGVVDRDARVFGVENLYIAGSSVFPTCGSTNPTFTILALSLRLADHLKRKLSA